MDELTTPEMPLMPEEEQQDTGTDPLARYLEDTYSEYLSSSYRKRKIDEILANRKDYSKDLPEKSFPWKNCSNLTCGLSSIAVDGLEPRIANQLIGDEDFLTVLPVGEEDQDNSEYIGNFLMWVASQIGLQDSTGDIVHDVLIDGTKDVLCVWSEQQTETYVREMVPMLQTPDGQQMPMPSQMQDDPNAMQMLQQMGIRFIGYQDKVSTKQHTDFKAEVELIDIEDAFFADGADWRDRPYMRIIYPTLAELHDLSDENGGPYFNIDRNLLADKRDQTESEQEKDIDYSQYDELVKVAECYVRWEGEWMLCSYAIDRGWIEIRRQPLKEVYWHGRLPIQRFTIYQENNESMGTGIPQKIKYLSTGADDLINQAIDSGTIEIIPYQYVEDFTGMENMDTDIYPGKRIPIPKGSKVYFPNSNVKSVAFLQFINFLLGLFEREISLMDHTMSDTSQSQGAAHDTSSGLSLVVAEGNIKHQYQGSGLRSAMGALMLDLLTLYAQYMPSDAKQRIFQDNKWVFEPVDVMALQGRYDVQIQVSNASANKAINRQEKGELYSMSLQNPMVNPEEPLRDVLKSYGIKDVDKWIKPEVAAILSALQQAPELPQVIQQYLQQKQQQERQQQIAGEAQANIERQDIERQVEAPVEERKLVDQAQESIKRKVITDTLKTASGVQ